MNATNAQPDAVIAAVLYKTSKSTLEPMASERWARAGEAILERLRAEETARIAKDIEYGALITQQELQARMPLDPESINKALQASELFSIAASDGTLYFPAFFADPRYVDRGLGKVTKALGDLPASVKYRFFSRRLHQLQGTPLKALADWRIDEVLKVALHFSN
jgi:hypothetical protein